jgi:AcrR family transcriptional regulator
MTEEDGPRQRAAATRRQRTRAKLLDAALTLFDERGWHGTSVDDIASAADVSTATLYNHFKTKQALAAEAFAPLLAGVAEAVRAEISSSQDPLEATIRYVRDLAIRVHDHGALPFLAVHPGLKEAGKVLRRLMATPLAEVIEYGQRTGAFCRGHEALVVASYATTGLMLELLAHRSAKHAARATLNVTLPTLLHGESEHEMIARILHPAP